MLLLRAASTCNTSRIARARLWHLNVSFNVCGYNVLWHINVSTGVKGLKVRGLAHSQYNYSTIQSSRGSQQLTLSAYTQHTTDHILTKAAVSCQIVWYSRTFPLENHVHATPLHGQASSAYIIQMHVYILCMLEYMPAYRHCFQSLQGQPRHNWANYILQLIIIQITFYYIIKLFISNIEMNKQGHRIQA